MNEKAFPKRVEYRGCTATIYLQTPRNATRYEVRFYDVDGAQQRLTFATYVPALSSMSLKPRNVLIRNHRVLAAETAALPPEQESGFRPPPTIAERI